jgi:hypothetical protein
MINLLLWTVFWNLSCELPTVQTLPLFYKACILNIFGSVLGLEKRPVPFRFRIQFTSRVSDPHWFNSDPDPAFFLLRIQIQFGIQGFDDQKLEREKFQLKKCINLFDQKLQFAYL